MGAIERTETLGRAILRSPAILPAAARCVPDPVWSVHMRWWSVVACDHSTHDCYSCRVNLVLTSW